MAMSERAKAARNAYMREYRRKHRVREKERMENFWERKAEKMEQATAEESEGAQDD